MTDNFDNDPIARDLRASFERHAREAPRGDLLAERIIRTTDGANVRTVRRSWRTWSLPLIAAGAVAAVVAVVAGIQDFQSNASGPQQPGNSGTASVLQSPATSAPSTSAPTTPAPADTTTVHNVKVLDLTFAYGEGWALASADCVSGTGRCAALLHNKGKQWWSLPNSTPFNVPGVTGGCTDPCVTSIRFATTKVGYAFGSSAFFMTTNGGTHWTSESGGAIALESLDDNVIRVIASSPSGCPGPCDVQVETAAIGSSDWTLSDLPAVSGAGVDFARGQPSNAYLLVKRNPAGGAQDETSSLYRSTDNGAHWSAAAEPCPRTNGEVDSTAIAGGGDDRVSVLCVPRQLPHAAFVANSTNDGASFSASPGIVGMYADLLTGDSTTVLLTGGNGLLRSTDGGRSWHQVSDVTGPIGFVGTESSTVGRAVSSDGRTIWTTRDGGQTWQPVHLG